ncbi:MAG: adenine-specific methyltransferase EcoRI family protein [Synergistaceae bacterium]|nr:adenine-specific methyltransferase EcoRI family protein [Synergistaceae bacterium]
MAKNASLNRAFKARQDEFYTRREDIENELFHYMEYFRGKVVYCNCDDPHASEFWQYFVQYFEARGLKKLIATHYNPDEKNFTYKLEKEPDEKGQFSIVENPKVTPLPCNGDFRSAACIELLKEADIVVTNPPFSLFREYVAQLMEYGKKFIILGNQNAITYKEIFPLLQNNSMWLGYNVGDMSFKVPDYYEPRETRYWQDETGQKWRSMGNMCWFTNLDIPKRHELISLHGNYYKGNEEHYPHYDNYDAIEVSRLVDIPCDYDGCMGVPITFMNVYCPEQFEIVGNSSTLSGPVTDAVSKKTKDNPGRFYVKGKRLYDRLVIKKKEGTRS